MSFKFRWKEINNKQIRKYTACQVIGTKENFYTVKKDKKKPQR